MTNNFEQANYQYQKVSSKGMPKTKGQCKRNFQIAMNEIINCGD